MSLEYYKAKGVIWQGKNPEGKIFSLYGDKKDLLEYAATFLNHFEPENPEEEDDEYSITRCEIGYDEHPTQEQRDADKAELKALLDDIAENGWMKHFIKMPRKKNNSLYKNRVQQLWRGDTFGHFWEESYGCNAPEISLKALDDYAAVLELTSRVVGY